MPQTDTRSLEAVELPAPAEAWPEAADGHRLGYRSREACQAAASWWPAVEVERWTACDCEAEDCGCEPAQRWPTKGPGSAQSRLGGPGRARAGYRAGSEAPGRVVVQDSWIWSGRRWFDPETGEVVDQILDRTLPASLDPIIRTLEISPGKLRFRTFGLSNAGAGDPLPALIEQAFQTQDGEAGDMWEQLELALDELEASGVVLDFSARSRQRLREAVAEVDWSDAVTTMQTATGRPCRLVFVMLSYPGDWRRWAPNPEACWNHLDRLYKRLNRRLFGRDWDGTVKVPWVWKREFQRRGAPHFHLVTVVPDDVGDGEGFRPWLKQAWFEVVGSGDRRHLRAGVRVDRVIGFQASDPARIASYLAGYLGPDEALSDKEAQHVLPYGWRSETGGAGRWWGTRGTSRVRVEVRITRNQLIEAQRLLRQAHRTQVRLREARRVAAGGPRATRRQLSARWLTGTETGGALIVADGPALAVGIARALALGDVEPWPKGVRRPLP